jgi:hypothetical protein
LDDLEGGGTGVTGPLGIGVGGGVARHGSWMWKASWMDR